MPEMSNTVPGAPCWIELSTSDIDRSLAFYAEVLRWEPTAGDHALGDGYITFYRAGKKLAGARKRTPGETGPDRWISYLMTPDAAAAASAITAAGGRMLGGLTELPGLGTMGLAHDPGGAQFGLWQPNGHAGYGLFGQHATAVWHELHTREFAESVAFYERAFGWTMESLGDSDDFRYSRFVVDGVPQAGIFDASRHLDEGVASNWQVYVGATNVDHTLGNMLMHGAHVVQVPEDTPFGRIAGVTDPTGAYFKLSSVPG